MPFATADPTAECAKSLGGASMMSDDTATGLAQSFNRAGSFAMGTTEAAALLAGKKGADEATIPLTVWMMYAVSAVCQCAQTLTEFIAWFIIKSRGWAKDQNPTFYGMTYAISSFVPVVMNPVLGWISHKTSVRVAMIFAMSISILGMITMVYSLHPLYYAAGYLLYSLAAIRPLRTAYIAQATEPAVRTRALAYLNLWTDGAKMMGLMTAKICDRIIPDGTVSTAWSLFNVQLNRLTLSLLSSIMLFLIAILTLLFGFKEHYGKQEGGGATVAKIDVEYTRDIKLKEPNGVTRVYDGNRHATMIVVAFCAIFMLHQSACGSVSVSNLPVLTERFQLDGAEAATIKLVQEILGMPTPLLVAALAPRVSDRTLFLCGILLAWAAIILFGCPPGASVYQPILGMGVGHASQTFFFTAGFSMLSKVMGVRSNGTLMAFVASCAALGSTCGNLAGGHLSMPVYGTPAFLLTLGPSALGLLVLLSPPFWRRLSPEDPVTQQVLESWARDASGGKPDPSEP